ECQAEEEARGGEVPEFVEAYEGEGEIETYTVHYKRDGSVRFGVVVGRTLDGKKRFLAKIPASDAAGIEFLISGREEPVGTKGSAVPADEASDGIMYWKRG
ncbi:MAG TPA: acetyl-CoA acetyltransferase, partial [Hyphomonadaceae bacterium]|nr:acetyl-CoA acetyltransferase [Hyphomonadaceae bacterium]